MNEKKLIRSKYQKNHQPGIWDSARISFDECVDMTIQSIKEIEGLYKTWIFMWSGGKDSTTLVTLIISLINSGQIKGPERIKIFIADTRMELTPLWFNALEIKAKLESMGYDVEIVLPVLDERFWVYMLGYGVPPPSNTFRWCTPKLKIDPIQRRMEDYVESLNSGKPKEEWEKVLMMTGVRVGESAARDARIKMSCSKDGAECGQGHYHHISKNWMDRLAPVIHWRVCAIWDWLRIFAPMPKYGSWPTAMLAEAYGGDEAEEKNARTGCIGCNLASKDKALLEIIKIDNWKYLNPLLKIRDIYSFLKKPENRLRKTGYITKKDGQGSKNQNRMGPMTMAARKEGLAMLKSIIEEVNSVAAKENRPAINLLNKEEENRIKWHWKNNSWPQGWEGSEQVASKDFIQYYSNGTSQPSLFSLKK